MESIIKRIENVTDNLLTPTREDAEEFAKSAYQMQALGFLEKTSTKIFIKFVGLKKPCWSDQKVDTYNVTLSNEKHEYSFLFHNSYINTIEGKSLKLDFYSILACLDGYCPDTLDDFLSEYGFEIKTSRDFYRARKTYSEVKKQVQNLKRLFTSEQLDQLAGIA